MTYHILVPDNLNPAGIDMLNAVEAFEITAPGKMSREETIAALPTAHALIIRSGTTADADLLAHTENLRVIVRAGVGVDNVDLDECTRRGIVVMNTPDGNTIATAEHTFGLMLALARHIPQGDASLRAGRWDRKLYMGTELHGKMLGLIGFGRVGRAVAKRAQAFEMTEIAYDPFVPPDIARHLGIPIVPTLDDLFAQADIISLHAVVTDDTREIINAETIAKMKDGVLIINAARGALVNNADLAAALKTGKVAGAALDVYDVEPPATDNPLLGLDNVVYTPHLGASTREAQEAVGVHAATRVIEALLKGKYTSVRNKPVLEKI
ncbi:MAG: phosphoglycerate dehydrogenase [Chloroflexi bacterium]|nr:phosphoglycerate dehydrogenase [Chloroflexota bacterium]